MKIETWEQLKEAVDCLNQLLKDEQPGLSSWCMMYGETMKSIMEYWENN